MITRILKVSGISLGGILLLLFIFPYLFPGLVAEQVKKWANQHISGELNYTTARLSFFRHFPSLTLTLQDFSLKGSAPFAADTLVASREIALGVDVASLLFSSRVIINKVFLTNAVINVQVNAKGEANYNIYQASSAKDKKAPDESNAGGSVKIERIEIENSHLVYNDRSLPVLLDANGFNYVGKGDLSETIFKLRTKASINSLDFYLDDEPYILNKKISARLITKVNTGSLAFVFERNRLTINNLPLEFTGKLDFLDKGYDMDFSVRSGKTTLHDLITALPPSYNTWLQKATVKGAAEISTALKGQYIVSENKMPDLRFSLKLTEGYIAYDKAPLPVSHIRMNLDVNMPALNADSLQVSLDTLSFKLDKDYFEAGLVTKGIAQPVMDIKANLHAQLDLERLTRTLGISGISLNGGFKMAGSLNGRYERGKAMGGWKPRQFPRADLALSWQNGQLGTSAYPHPIRDIQMTGHIKNTTGSLKDLEVDVQPASFVFEDAPFHLTASLKDFEDIGYDVALKGTLDVKKISRVFMQEKEMVPSAQASKGEMNISGFVKADLHLQGKQSDALNGQYDRLNNEGTLDLQDIAVSSDYFPLPFLIKEGLFRFKEDKIYFNGFRAAYGSSDLSLDGYLQNTVNYVLSEDQPLKGDLTLQAGFIEMNELMAFSGNTDSSGRETVFDHNAAGKPGSVQIAGEEVAAVQAGTPAGPGGPSDTEAREVAGATDSSGVIRIPPELDLHIRAGAAKVAYKELSLQDVKADLRLKAGEAILTETGFGLIGCKVNMNARYRGSSAVSADFDYSIKATDFDVQRAYREISLFRDMVPSAETAKGIVSLDYRLSGRLNADMYPVFPSLTGGGVLAVKDVQVKGFKLFGVVSNKTGESSLKDPQFKGVELKTTIRNNIITLERTKMKVAGFRPRIEGQTSFDGRLNLKMRLGLPPLGIIGIPIAVTGTQDKPVIKLGKKTEDLTEQKDEENTEAPVKVPEPL